MKTQFRFHLLAAAFLFAGTAVVAQSDQEEVPGDNFSLEGALELFKKSASPQEFEQLLNSPDSKVNNLDLNADGETDYVRVIDRTDGNVHTFTMQAVVSTTEAQDIAVIELEKRGDGTAVLQIVGDADIYGIETIIEPTDEVRVNAGTMTSRATVNVWAWPSVQYVYGPYYSMWVSPWRWSYYPMWYRPWRPVAYYAYRPYWAPYRPYYSVCYTHRVFYGSRLYSPYRTSSVIVYNRYNSHISQYRSNHRYNNSYSAGRSNNTSGQRHYDRSGATRSYNRNNSSGTSDNDSRRRSTTYQPNRYNGSSRSNGNSNNSSNNSNNITTPRPSRQFSAPAQNQPSGGGQRHRSFSAPSGGNSNPGGGSHQRSFSTPSGGASHQRSHTAPSGGNSGGNGGGNASHGRRH